MALAHRWVLRLSSKPVGYEVQYHADQDLGELRSYRAHDTYLRARLQAWIDLIKGGW